GGRDDRIGHIHHIAHLEIDGDAAYHIRLFARPAPLLEKLDHLDDRVARRESDVAALVRAVIAHRHAHRGDEFPWRCPLRLGKILWVREAWPDDVVARSFVLVYAKAYGNGSTHFYRRAATLRVALSEMPVSNGVQGAFHVHGNKQSGAHGQLLHVRVPAVLPRRYGAQAVLRDRLVRGTALLASARKAVPPRFLSSASRLAQRRSCSCDGATPAVPMKAAFGIRPPGNDGEVAHSWVKPQCTRNG